MTEKLIKAFVAEIKKEKYKKLSTENSIFNVAYKNIQIVKEQKLEIIKEQLLRLETNIVNIFLQNEIELKSIYTITEKSTTNVNIQITSTKDKKYFKDIIKELETQDYSALSSLKYTFKELDYNTREIQITFKC